MPTQPLTQHSYQQVVSANSIVLVKFWASWCGWCTKFEPVYSDSAAQHPEIVYGTVDTEAERELTALAQIQSLPSLLAYREGLLVYAHPGFQNAAQLEEVVQRVRWLDMDEVRRERGLSNEPAEQARPAPAAPRAGPAGGRIEYGWPGLRTR
ncbi:MAG: thioredoxin family protein [Nocardia sp.]|nr:thioredoxin family protein [Nocardia sp.]